MSQVVLSFADSPQQIQAEQSEQFILKFHFVISLCLCSEELTPRLFSILLFSNFVQEEWKIISLQPNSHE